MMRIWRFYILGPLLLLQAFFWIGCKESRPVVPPLPATAEIRSIKAHYFDRSTNQEVEFDVPPGHWRAIFSALQPARLDPEPSKWVMLGRLDITLKNGRPFRVGLYWVRKGVGAFSAGGTHESRLYYRGGVTSELERAMQEALVVEQEARN